MKTLDKTAIINSIKENDKLLGETVKAIESLETLSYEAPDYWYLIDKDGIEETRAGRIEKFIEELKDIKKELFEESEGYGEILKTL